MSAQFPESEQPVASAAIRRRERLESTLVWPLRLIAVVVALCGIVLALALFHALEAPGRPGLGASTQLRDIARIRDPAFLALVDKTRREEMPPIRASQSPSGTPWAGHADGGGKDVQEGLHDPETLSLVAVDPRTPPNLYLVRVPLERTGGRVPLELIVHARQLPLSRVWLVAPSEVPREWRRPGTDAERAAAHPPESSRALLPLTSEFGPLGNHATLPSINEDAAWLVLQMPLTPLGNPNVHLVPADQVQATIETQQIRGATYTAVFVVLALLSLCVALVDRSWFFVMLSAFILCTLRTLAMNEGWGIYWLLEHSTPSLIRRLVPMSLAAHVALAIYLCHGLLGQDPLLERPRRMLRAGIWLMAALTLCTPFLSDAIVYLTSWTVAALAVPVALTSFAALLIVRRPQANAILIALGLTAMAAMFTEIVRVAGLLHETPLPLNLRTGVVLAALASAIAIGLRMRQEIRNRRIASLEARRVRDELKRSYDEMPIGLFTCDDAGLILRCNPAFEQLFQRLTGHRPVVMSSGMSELSVEPRIEELSRVAGMRETSPIIASARQAEGGERVHLSIRLRRNGRLFDCSVEDVSEQIRAQAAVEHLVEHDPLTGALNQRGLDMALADAIGLSKTALPCCFADLDIDRFKLLNDLYGLRVADDLLCAIARVVSTHLHDRDSLTRIGDSFKVIFVNQSADEALRTMDLIVARIESEPVALGDRLLNVTASAGVVEIRPGMESRDIVATASQACLIAKQRGRNQVALITAQDTALAGYLEDLNFQADLKRHLQSDRFFLEFQPIISFDDPFGSPAYEALIRMRDSENRTVPPSRFIPAAERNGQMTEIDRWVLSRMLQLLDEHRTHLDSIRYATINLSGSSLNDGRFLEDVHAMLEDLSHVARKLCFEVTETVALADRRATRRFVERIHSMGGKIALDDFGAGYTSFTYLRELAADILKLDGSFVRDIQRNPANRSITRMVSELAHELGKSCVAEWVEDEQILKVLLELGLDAGQGYGLVRPLPAEEVVLMTGVEQFGIDARAHAVLLQLAQRGRDPTGRPAMPSLPVIVSTRDRKQ